MTVVEWHPDELLDKQRSGPLNASERRRLDDHLARCAACRVEALAIEDFALELESAGDDERIRGSLSRLVHVAVAERAPSVARRRFLPAVVAAVALLAAGSAAALYAKRSVGAPATAVLEEIVRDIEKEARVTPAKRTSPGKPSLEEKKTTAPESIPSAAALFASANQARRAGRRQEALRLYRELERRYPDSSEAKLTHAIVGRMLLDQDDPASALGEFDRYLGEGKGTLSEEALVGRALALQKLGRHAEERAAWEALLRSYPTSIHAARARARLAALGGG